MTGQICRFTPGFMLAKQLIEEGRIGEIACIESEYAHNYRLGAAGFQNWRRDAKVARENIVGGGCHAMDLLRWIMGEPTSVYAVSNHTGNLISVSSAFSKTSLSIWKFTVHVLLKSGLENFLLS